MDPIQQITCRYCMQQITKVYCLQWIESPSWFTIQSHRYQIIVLSSSSRPPLRLMSMPFFHYSKIHKITCRFFSMEKLYFSLFFFYEIEGGKRWFFHSLFNTLFILIWKRFWTNAVLQFTFSWFLWSFSPGTTIWYPFSSCTAIWAIARLSPIFDLVIDQSIATNQSNSRFVGCSSTLWLCYIIK